MRMDITVTPYEKRDLAGYAYVVFDNKYAVEHIQIKRSKDNNLYIDYPSVNKRSGEIKEIFHPDNLQTRADMGKAIITAYNNALNGQRKTEINDNEPPMKVTSVSTAQYEKQNMIGLANVKFSNGCVLESVQIKTGKNGEYLDMPKYKKYVTENGSLVFENGLPKTEYRSMLKPITKEAAAEMKQAVINNFNEKYTKKNNQPVAAHGEVVSLDSPGMRK